MRFTKSLFFISILLLNINVFAADFDGVRFLMISSIDHAVVIRDETGKLKLLKQGDVVGADHRIIGFDENTVILEGPGEWAPVKIFVEVTQGETKVTRLARRPIETYQFKGGR